jgi:hypothetical protein
MRLIRVAQLAVFALLCVASWYSNHLSFDGSTRTPDAIHTRLIQYGRGPGPLYVTADRYNLWQATWVVIVLLLVAFLALLYLSRRLRLSRM